MHTIFGENIRFLRKLRNTTDNKVYRLCLVISFNFFSNAPFFNYLWVHYQYILFNIKIIGHIGKLLIIPGKRVWENANTIPLTNNFFS